MPEVYRESRTYTRERDDSPSDEERYNKTTTVRRYKVTPTRLEREVDVIDDDVGSQHHHHRHHRHHHHGHGHGHGHGHSHSHSHHGSREPRESIGSYTRGSQAELLEVDRRVTYVPDRPHSAFDPSPRSSTTVVEKQVYEHDRDIRDRDRDDYYRSEYREIDRPRTTLVEREKIVERERDEARGQVASPRDWERRSHATWDRDDRETDVRVERRVERRVTEERRDDGYMSGGEVERYRKETEYYDAAPTPVPIVIRQRAPEPQKIILQDAPPANIIVQREREENRELVRREPREDEYYYQRESRELGPYRDDRREEDYALARYDRRGGHRRRHDRYYSDGEGEEDHVYVKRTIIRRERSRSTSPEHRRHLAEGALAGAGISALMASRRNAAGELPQHRGRNVLAGAAMGALGTEIVRRARSAYRDHEDYDHRDDRRSRSRSRSKMRDRIKTAIGIGAVALAAAGAAKYMQSSKIEKEELGRGRSRNRDRGRYSSDYSRSPSLKHEGRSKSRSGSVLPAAVGTAAVAGLVNHFRSKSRPRNGSRSKSRSRSRLRTGAGIVGAGLAGAAAKKLYDKRRDSQDAKKEASRERDFSDRESDDYDHHHRSRDARSRSVSRTRSAGPHPHPSDVPSAAAADPELGMVEYGTDPLYSDPLYSDPRYGTYAAGGGGAPVDYDLAEEEEEGRHHRRRGSRTGSRRRSRDGGYDSGGKEGAYGEETDRDKKKKRSRSRLRDAAAAAAGASAAAIGVRKYSDAKEEKDGRKKDQIRDRDRDRDGDRDRDRDDRRRDRERERRRYEEETSTDGYEEPFPQARRTPSPPHASGGAYYPPPHPYAGAGPTAAAAGAGFTQHPNMASTNLAQQYTPYQPPDYTRFQPSSPPGPPPNSAATANDGFSPDPPPHPMGPEYMV